MPSTMYRSRIARPKPAIAIFAPRSACRPILDLDMRLGEASGAALSVAVLRAALACHLGMATFDEAQVDERG